MISSYFSTKEKFCLKCSYKQEGDTVIDLSVYKNEEPVKEDNTDWEAVGIYSGVIVAAIAVVMLYIFLVCAAAAITAFISFIAITST